MADTNIPFPALEISIALLLHSPHLTQNLSIYLAAIIATLFPDPQAQQCAISDTFFQSSFGTIAAMSPAQLDPIPFAPFDTLWNVLAINLHWHIEHSPLSLYIFVAAVGLWAFAVAALFVFVPLGTWCVRHYTMSVLPALAALPRLVWKSVHTLHLISTASISHLQTATYITSLPNRLASSLSECRGVTERKETELATARSEASKKGRELQKALGMLANERAQRKLADLRVAALERQVEYNRVDFKSFGHALRAVGDDLVAERERLLLSACQVTLLEQRLKDSVEHSQGLERERGTELGMRAKLEVKVEQMRKELEARKEAETIGVNAAPKQERPVSSSGKPAWIPAIAAETAKDVESFADGQCFSLREMRIQNELRAKRLEALVTSRRPGNSPQKHADVGPLSRIAPLLTPPPTPPRVTGTPIVAPPCLLPSPIFRHKVDQRAAFA